MGERYEMLMERNTGIPMRDGSVLRGDVFRPKADGKFPVLMTFGPYGKGVPLREFMQEAWDAIEKFYPDILANSSCKHLVWETPDPETWVPDGYIIMRVDARGCGKSPGRLRPGETGATKGVGWMYHEDPQDRPPAIFHGTHAVHTGGGRDAYLLLPVLPAR